MFNLSGSEIIIILLLALVVLGPEKLPDAIRGFGRFYAEFKRMSTSFQDEVRSTLDEPMREMRETADLLREQATFDVDDGESATESQRSRGESRTEDSDDSDDSDGERGDGDASSEGQSPADEDGRESADGDGGPADADEPIDVRHDDDGGDAGDGRGTPK